MPLIEIYFFVSGETKTIKFPVYETKNIYMYLSAMLLLKMANINFNKTIPAVLLSKQVE